MTEAVEISQKPDTSVNRPTIRKLAKRKIYGKRELKSKLEEIYAPFDVMKFYEENEELVHKFLKKNTNNLEISEVVEIPEEFQYKNQPTVLSAFGEKSLSRSLLEKLEWIKCAIYPIYYFKKYINIILVSGKTVKFNPRDFQLEMIDLIENNRFTVGCWARQLGKSTIVSSYFLWMIHFYPGKQAGILANKADQAQEIMERIQTSYELMPLFMKPGVRVYNKRSMRFQNKSKVFCSASSKSAIRGKSLSILLWDEAGHTPNDVEFYNSVYSTISSGEDTKLVMISTPNGKRGVFYKTWVTADNGFAKTFARWCDVPGRDQSWKDKTIKATSKEQFAQEHDCVFSGSADSLIASAIMENLIHKPPCVEYDSGLKIYKPVQEGHVYIINCDVSRGVGGDYQAFTVVDISEKKKYEVAATFRNNTMSPLIYPTLIHNVALKYNKAFVLIEINDIGEQVANILYFDLEYENVLMTVKEKNKTVLGFSHDAKPGMRTTIREKSIGCSNLKSLVEDGQIELNDEDLIDELGNFVPHGKVFAAAEGAHDDLVMTLVFFSWAVTQPYFKDLTDSDIRKKMFEEKKLSDFQDMLPFGIIENEFGEFEGITDDMNESGRNPLYAGLYDD